MIDRINQIAEAIRRLSKCDSYIINIDMSEKPGIFDSKFGGLPYWPLNKEYPTNCDGEKLLLLAQINFNSCKVDSPLPQNGLLQFFIEDGPDMGLDTDEPTVQDGFRVIYHEEIDERITEEDLKTFGIPNPNDESCKEQYEFFPIAKECKIFLTKSIDYINNNPYNFGKVFSKAYKEVYEEDLPEDKGVFDVMNDMDSNKLFEVLKQGIMVEHKMLGYPEYIEGDPRENGNYEDYDTCLLQIDSDKNISIGNNGVCNFLIPRKSLLEKDFSNVFYHWEGYIY